MKKILIVARHPLMSRGLALTLQAEPDLQVCAQVADAAEALAALDTMVPDLVLVDISLPDVGGLALISHLRSRHPCLRALVISRHEATSLARRALGAGARGYVLRKEVGECLVEAVQRVLAGGLYVSEEINQQLLLSLTVQRRDLSPWLDPSPAMGEAQRGGVP
ncbi:MAG: response regulator transcription factor [Rhodothermales bacterium]